MYYTYLISSKKDTRWYTGCTDDLRKRFKTHNVGQVPSTKGRGPFELMYYEACHNKNDAYAREKYLKTGMGKRYLKNRLKRFLALTGLIVVMGMYAHSSDAATISRPTQSLGLVGYWSFDVGKGGAKAVDMSGRGNNGTLTNMNTTAAWVGGKIGQALSFDGVNDSVVIGDVELVTTQATFSLWAKFNVVSGTVLSKYGSVKAYRLFITGDEIRFGLNTDVNNDTTAANIVANTWYHIVGVFNGASSPKLQDIYINGAKQVMTGATIPNSIDDVTAQIKIGEQDNAAQQVNGLIDEVRVYNRALSAEEVKRLYRQTSPQFNASQANKLRQGLVGMWTFDGVDMGTTSAIDRSGSGNTGWLINGTKKVIGKFSQALSFDGSNDYVNLPIRSNTNQTSQALWVKLTTTKNNGFLFANDIQTNWLNSVNLDASPVWYTRFVQGGTRDDLTFSAISTGVWTHLVFVYDGVADVKTIYKDGLQVARKSPTSHGAGTLQLSTAGLHAVSESQDGIPIDGLIDEIGRAHV